MIRRTAFLNFQPIFVDETSAVDNAQADQLRKRGLPECLVQVIKDKHCYENHVEQHLSTFLRFFVKGDVAYYKNKGSIDIPKRMQITAQQETRGDGLCQS